jgi:hypothetical protein
VTGGFFPDAQKWLAEGVVALREGVNRIRLERDSYFPHIDKLLLVARPGAAVTRSPEQAAAEQGLVPELFSQAVEQVRAGAAEVTFTLPEDPTRLFSTPAQAELSKLGAEIAELEKSKPALPRAMAVSEGTPTDMKLHIRGSYLTLAEDCPRRFPAVLASAGQPLIERRQSGRLELARWMTRPEHPLTARVFVNRVWRWHFGRGIVPSTDNFGTLGERPVNQGLLDWLAGGFAGRWALKAAPTDDASRMTDESTSRERFASVIRHPSSARPSAWSLKSLHRLIMLSSAYQMSTRYDARAARVDPENKLHWRHDRRRLEAEEIRDAILAVSGRLDRTMGGSLLTFKEREYVTSTANAETVNYRSPRRSVYLPVVRSALYDVFTAFDFGDPAVLNGDRATTTVAPQALFMMNSAVVLEQSKAMAAALLEAAPDDATRIQRAYETCYGRPATAAEVRRATELLERVSDSLQAKTADAAARRLAAWQSLCKGLIGGNEFIYID